MYEVVAKERQRRMEDEIERSRPSSALAHLQCSERRVAIDRFEVIGDAVVSVMLQFVGQAADGAVGRDCFVHSAAGPAGGAAIVEARLEVRIPVS